MKSIRFYNLHVFRRTLNSSIGQRTCRTNPKSEISQELLSTFQPLILYPKLLFLLNSQTALLSP
jgi:hypothetical protein